MALTVGYMVTWTMYGTWLQGDGRGYVKDGEVRGADEKLYRANRKNLVRDPVRLGSSEKRAVARAIMDDAKGAGEKVAALAVCSSHVHAAVRYTCRDVGEFVGRSKAAGRRVLREVGFEGKVWARGYDVRFCFDEEAFGSRVEYVARHGEG